MTENETIDTAEIDRGRVRSSALEAKHSQGLTTLMGERIDLRGVHRLADHLVDAIRWTA